ncbi:hypothetical protein ALC56_13371 [Trachymyrmex septentrionalis]|uniref:Uncharacterized protein n=1 Tax=Trachymyrmex septentrionalis TaxID=34720 RepID=A0A195EWA1_9HYME|nr:hypothetical protein ALC56_13371 [Trachymyrmex septentrionalis]
MAETRDSSLVSDAVAGAASGQQPIPLESGAQGDEDLSGRAVEESTKTVATSEAANTEQIKTQINGDIAVTSINLSLSEVVSLLGLADDDEVLAGTSEESRKRALWQFYSTGMLTHSHSDGEFPIYSQDADGNERPQSITARSHYYTSPYSCSRSFGCQQITRSERGHFGPR